MSRPISATVDESGRQPKGITGNSKPPTSQTSPTQSSPGLSQSTSNSVSNSSSSPPEPMTPPRTSRSQTRYPDLGRVPLHRRGTSKTYERLEDLLKEAGYKETRIFTPETDRTGAHGDSETEIESKRLSVMKDGMGAVVGFLAGFMPNVAGSRSNLSAVEPGKETELAVEYTSSPQDYSPAPSPLARRQLPAGNRVPRPSLELTEPPTPSVTSSIDSLAEPTPKLSRQYSSRSVHSNSNPPPSFHQHQQQQRQTHRTSSQLSSYASNRMQKQSSRTSLAPPPNIASPRPSRAGAYLRHMASAPSIPHRPNSTPVHLTNRLRLTLNDSDAEDPELSTARRGNGEGEGPDEPPLPPSWLETVARAVLFGGVGARIGGPSASAIVDAPLSSSSARKTERTLRSTRSSLSQVSSHRKRPPLTARSGLSDQTNTALGSGFLAPPAPPSLFAKIERGRSGRSEGEVAMARVTCRSAPGSRTTSMVRGGYEKDSNLKRKEERGRGRKRREEKDRMPSLARTQVEGDVWVTSSRRKTSGRGAIAGFSKPHLDMGGRAADVEWADDAYEPGSTGGLTGTSSSEEDEGELDLARILVPPKRQNSIKSLRKHLASEGTSSSGAQAKLKNLAASSASEALLRTRSARGMSVGSHTPTTPAAATAASTLGFVLPKHPSTTTSSNDPDYDAHLTEEWGGGWVRKSRHLNRASSEDDEDTDSFAGFFGEGRRDAMGSGRSSAGGNRSRLGSAWGRIGGGS